MRVIWCSPLELFSDSLVHEKMTPKALWDKSLIETPAKERNSISEEDEFLSGGWQQKDFFITF